MKRERLFDAITDLRDDLIEGAGKRRRNRWIAPLAAVAAVVITVTAILRPWGAGDPKSAYALAEAVYPTDTAQPQRVDYESQKDFEKALKKWKRKRDPALKELYGVADGSLTEFAQGITREMMGEAEGENRIFSPLSLYMSLCMLAECADGDSREQILTVMKAPDMEGLREQANLLWRNLYENDEELQLIPANSLWLDQKITVDQPLMKRLATDYYASSYQGDLQDPGFLQEMKNRISRETGAKTDEIKMADDTLLSLFSTLRYSAQWMEEFREDATKNGTFYTPTGATECDFMEQMISAAEYYRGEGFEILGKELYGDGTLYFVLPEEGSTPEQLSQNTQFLDWIGGNELKTDRPDVHLIVPKFDLTAETDPAEALKALGITDVFDDQKATFNGLRHNLEGNLYLKQFRQSSLLKIDEKGCVGAAFTQLDLAVDKDDEEDQVVEFNLNRPFWVVLKEESTLPLFVGIVNQP